MTDSTNQPVSVVGSDNQSVITVSGRQTVEVHGIHENTKQEVIVITIDRARLCLMEHADKVAARFGWAAPLGLLASTITTFCSATFHDAFGLEAAAWKMLFIIIGMISSAWLIKEIWAAWKSPSIDDLISKMKNQPSSSGSKKDAERDPSRSVSSISDDLLSIIRQIYKSS